MAAAAKHHALQQKSSSLPAGAWTVVDPHITATPSVWRIEDLKSTNGLFVNGVK